jgi:uncharacterized protein YuzE
MEFDYDPEANAGYVRRVHGKVDRTLSIRDVVMIDLDVDGNVIGVEILGPAPLAPSPSA